MTNHWFIELIPGLCYLMKEVNPFKDTSTILYTYFFLLVMWIEPTSSRLQLWALSTSHSATGSCSPVQNYAYFHQNKLASLLKKKLPAFPYFMGRTHLLKGLGNLMMLFAPELWALVLWIFKANVKKWMAEPFWVTKNRIYSQVTKAHHMTKQSLSRTRNKIPST